MTIVVRPYKQGGAVALIEQALGSAPSNIEACSYVAVGDPIDTDEQACVGLAAG